VIRNPKAQSTAARNRPVSGSARDLPGRQERAGQLQVRIKRLARFLPPDAQPPKYRVQACLPAGRPPYAPPPTADDTAAVTAHARARFSDHRLLRCGTTSSMPRAADAGSSPSLLKDFFPTTCVGTCCGSRKWNNFCARRRHTGPGRATLNRNQQPPRACGVDDLDPVADTRASGFTAAVPGRTEGGSRRQSSGRP